MVFAASLLLLGAPRLEARPRAKLPGVVKRGVSLIKGKARTAAARIRARLPGKRKLPRAGFVVPGKGFYGLPDPGGRKAVAGRAINECGIACAAMVVGTRTGTTPTLSDVRSVSREYPGGYSRQGTRINNLPLVLRHYGVKASEAVPMQSLGAIARATRGGKNPAIVHVHSAVNPGEIHHAVVVDRVQWTPFGRMVHVRDPDGGRTYKWPEIFFHQANTGWAVYSK